MYAFSDGSPFYELMVAVFVFVVCVAITRILPVARWLDCRLTGLVTFFRRRGLFTGDDPVLEQRRIDLLRIVAGTLAAWSAGQELVAALLTGEALTIGLQMTALALALLVAIGLGTPVAALVFALLLNLIVDNLARASNLGSMVLAILLMAFAFAPAGRSLSVDAWLVRRSGTTGALVRWLYAFWGPVSLDRAAVVKGCAFVAYAAISFHSALAHLGEEAWRTGAVNAWILLWPVSNPWFHAQADALYQAAPRLYVNVGRLSTWGILAWELTMLPLALLGRWTRGFVVVWGVLFFLVAVLVLPLRLLGWYELLLWALLFWDLRRPGGATARGVYNSGPVVMPRAFALAFGILLAAFLVRLPYLRDLPVASTAALWSTRLVGQAPLVFGIGPVNVYNRNQLDLRLRTTVARWTDGQDVVADAQSVSQRLPRIEQYRASIMYGRLAASRAVCGDEEAYAYFARFGNQYAYLAAAPGRSGPLVFVADFLVFDWPTIEDLQAYRYRPVEPTTVCRVSSVVGSGRPPSVVFTERGAEMLAEQAGLSFRPRPDRAELLLRFPCRAEAERLAWWFDRPNLAPRGPEATPAAQKALAGLIDKSPVQCFADMEAALRTVDLDWRPAHPPPPAPCEPDLELARAYATATAGDPLASTVTEALGRAQAALSRRDHATCLLAAAEIRRAYVLAVGGP